jgi:hypothetical protein
VKLRASKEPGPRRVPLAYMAGAMAVALLVSWFVPFGRILLYPLTLFATWVHELGHALVEVLLGGRVLGIHVYASSAGDAMCAPFGSAKDGFVAAGGLLAPPLVGAALAVTAASPRRARAILVGFSAAILVSVAILVRSVFGGIVLVALAALFAWVAVRGGARTRLFFAQFLAVELGLDWLSRLDYFFTDSAIIEGQPSVSDAGRMAASFGGLPAFGWGALLVVISSIALYASLRWSVEREVRALEAGAARRPRPPR